MKQIDYFIRVSQDSRERRAHNARALHRMSRRQSTACGLRNTDQKASCIRKGRIDKLLRANSQASIKQYSS